MSSLSATLAVGPMSPEIIEAVFHFSHYHRKPLMLIASKNQIDHSGGYVNGWTTAQYMAYVKAQKEKYPQSAVLVCRDHCGPGFNGMHEIDDVYKTMDSDLANGFDLMHIDFCHYRGSYEEQLAESKKAIQFCLEKNPRVLLEIGTDENVGAHYNIPNIQEIEKEIDYFKNFCDPTFFVLQTGSLVKEINQAGNFNRVFIEQVAPLIHGKGIKLKEHNADYLSREEIHVRRGLVDAQNVAPQFGVVQTSVVLSRCLMYGVGHDDFINEAYIGGKWKKWLHTSTADNIFLCAVIAGHYHFSSPAYQKIIEKLAQHEDIQETIINHITEVLHHYVVA